MDKVIWQHYFEKKGVSSADIERLKGVVPKMTTEM